MLDAVLAWDDSIDTNETLRRFTHILAISAGCLLSCIFLINAFNMHYLGMAEPFQCLKVSSLDGKGSFIIEWIWRNDEWSYPNDLQFPLVTNTLNKWCSHMSIGPSSTTNRHVNGMTHVRNIRQIPNISINTWLCSLDFLDCTDFQRKNIFNHRNFAMLIKCS